MSRRKTGSDRLLTRILTPFWTLFFRFAPKHQRIGRVRIHAHDVDTAMHGALNVWTPWTGAICWHPSTAPWGDEWPWYFYVSPNSTPWAATFAIGRGLDLAEKLAARMRRARLGLVYDVEALSYEEINNAGITNHYRDVPVPA